MRSDDLGIESPPPRFDLGTESSRAKAQAAPVTGATKALACVEVVLASALVLMLLRARELPLVDLPQHVLALSEWLRIDAGDPTLASLELNFRTPYLLAYPVARALAVALPVLTALKLTLAASIVLGVVWLRQLCQRLGHDPWLGLLGFPLGLGYAFCFGFVAFCAALPLTYLAFRHCFAHRERPSLATGARLGLTLAILLVAHGVALAFSVLVLAPYLALGSRKLLLRRVWPLAAPFVVGWLWLTPSADSTRLGPDYFAFEPERALEIPGQLVGIGSADPIASLLGACLLLGLCLSLGRLRSTLAWPPLALALLGYMLFPSLFRGAGPLGPRFACLFVPTALLGFSPRIDEGPRRRAARRLLLVAVATLVLSVFGSRLPGYAGETADFRRLIAELPSGLSLRPLIFERETRAFPGLPAHLHLAAYYSAEKQGDPGYSFAMYSISVVRLRARSEAKMVGGAEWQPERFDAAREATDYDYFIVKSHRDRGAELFPGPAPAAVLERHFGDFWGYRRRS